MEGNIGYKKCGSYLVTLVIPKNAITNQHREGVFDIYNAKHRTNIAYVKDIHHIHDIHQKSKCAISTYHKNWLRYVVGTFIKEPRFDMNLNKICAEGIHYFLNKDLAINYTGKKETYIGNIFDGICIYYNGQGKPVYTIQYKNYYPQYKKILT